MDCCRIDPDQRILDLLRARRCRMCEGRFKFPEACAKQSRGPEFSGMRYTHSRLSLEVSCRLPTFRDPARDINIYTRRPRSLVILRGASDNDNACRPSRSFGDHAALQNTSMASR